LGDAGNDLRVDYVGSAPATRSDNVISHVPAISLSANQNGSSRLTLVDPLGLAADATSLDFHRAVYRNASLPISTRQRSAIAALQFEDPKLAVHALIDEKSFAYRLERAIGRTARAVNGDAPTNQMKLIEAKPAKLRRL